MDDFDHDDTDDKYHLAPKITNAIDDDNNKSMDDNNNYLQNPN